MKKYVFRKYSSRFPEFFEIEKKRLERVVGGGARVEHVGSTAVPGLGGKGILDVLIGVGPNRLLQAKRDLIDAGYEFGAKASTPTKLFFRKDYTNRRVAKRIHVHLTLLNGRDFREKTCFRDYLIAHPKAAKEYARIKKEAATLAKGEGDIYIEHKARFVERVTRKALRWQQATKRLSDKAVGRR